MDFWKRNYYRLFKKKLQLQVSFYAQTRPLRSNDLTQRPVHASSTLFIAFSTAQIEALTLCVFSRGHTHSSSTAASSSWPWLSWQSTRLVKLKGQSMFRVLKIKSKPTAELLQLLITIWFWSWTPADRRKDGEDSSMTRPETDPTCLNARSKTSQV